MSTTAIAVTIGLIVASLIGMTLPRGLPTSSDDGIEPMVVAAAAATGAGLVRMVRGSASLEDLFMTKEPAP